MVIQLCGMRLVQDFNFVQGAIGGQMLAKRCQHQPKFIDGIKLLEP